MQYTKALVRKPSQNFNSCISSHPDHPSLSYSLALDQHQAYQNLLMDLGIEIIEIDKSRDFPDACFVEDNSVVVKNKALITHMGAESRRGEADEYLEILSQYFSIVQMNHLDGTLEGGDIIHVDNNFLISGITRRTNLNGVNKLENTLGLKVKTIKDPSIVHLKSYISYLGNETFISTSKYLNHPTLLETGYNILEVPKKESYAANALVVNGSVVLPTNSSITSNLIKEHGFSVEFLNMSEFAKCEGALTCLSVLF